MNPLAGIGGPVGLKGSDGPEIVARALTLGAVPEAPGKAVKALGKLEPIREEIQILTCPGDMGENEARQAGFAPEVIERLGGADAAGTLTTGRDTETAAAEMLARGVDLLLFVGGDGTARDVYRAVGGKLPALGIPAGVKIHSGVYGATPALGGEAALLFLSASPRVRLREAEVMDIDEEAFRADRVSARLYGYMLVPCERNLVQSAKAGSQRSEEADVCGIAADVVQNMEPDCCYFIGPGTTTRGIMELLGLKNTLLGVDVVCNKELVLSDANEAALLKLLEKTEPGRARIVVTAIGGQGHVFGRGNQQLSHRVIQQVGKENITVIATEGKLLGLQGKPLLADTGSDQLDRDLLGYVKVVTGLNRKTAYRIAGADE